MGRLCQECKRLKRKVKSEITVINYIEGKRIRTNLCWDHFRAWQSSNKAMKGKP